MSENTDTTEFILENSTKEESFDEVADENPNRFPIIPNLVIIGFILLGLFSTIVIPQTLSFLQLEEKPIVETVHLPPIATVAEAVSPFQNIKLQAKAVHVYDVANQKVLYEENSDEPLPLASITKLMTALLSYELMADETVVSISPASANQQSGGTLSTGETFLAKDLADFALISSYNSAAYTLADSVGSLLGKGEPVTLFVSAMNIRAEELGFTSFRFKNPTGLDISSSQAGAYGSASDVGHLVAYILYNYPEILLPTTKTHTRLYNQSGAFHEADNTNDIITDIPNILGSKTGYTDLAGGNLTIAFDAGYNHPIIITVLGSTHSERFADVKKLVEATTASLTLK